MLDFQKIAVSGANTLGLIGVVASLSFLVAFSAGYGWAVAMRGTGHL